MLLRKRARIPARRQKQIKEALARMFEGSNLERYHRQCSLISIGRLHAALVREPAFDQCRTELDKALYLVGRNQQNRIATLHGMEPVQIYELIKFARDIRHV